MTIDLHARLWDKPADLGQEAAVFLPRLRTDPWQDLSASPEGLLEGLGPVSQVVVRGLESRLLGAHISAPQVAAWCAQSGGRFIGAAGIDPTVGQGAKRAEEALALGLKAVAVSPAAAGFDPGQWHALKLFEACEAHGLPILCEGMEGLWGGAPSAWMEMARPHLWDPVLRRFPRLRLCLGGIGSPWVEEALTLLAKHEHAYADLSGLITRPAILRRAIVSAEERGIAHKLLLGSGYPFATPAEAVTRLLTLPPPTDDATVQLRAAVRGIIGRDSLLCLGIAAPPVAPSTFPQETA